MCRSPHNSYIKCVDYFKSEDMKIGDRVRFLNDVGGGIVARIDNNIAYVRDEDGFETPMPVKELVVVLPVGHENPYKNSAKLMFDQSVNDTVKARAAAERKEAELTKDVTPVEPPKPIPVEETKHGEKMSLVLAFEPSDLKRLNESSFAAVLVNDSNYYLSFVFARRDEADRNWLTVFCGEVEPNMVVDLANFTHEDLPHLSRLALQAIAYKKEDKSFEMKEPVNVELRLDTTKFYKLHCFRAGIYFDTPVLEVPVMNEDKLSPGCRRPTATRFDEGGAHDEAVRELKAKYREDRPESRRKKHTKNDADNPHKLLPLQEIDLHIHELVDTTAGMDNAAMLDLQLSTALKEMRKHEKRIGQKIVFIHGKGDGVLRNKLWERLRRDYPKAQLQDASFREYGFGATLVTIH